MSAAKVSLANATLSEALSVILPGQEETRLLRACLHAGEAGRQAWKVYQERIHDPRKVLRKDGRGVKALAPLLLTALRRNGVVADKARLTYLRAAYLREELRSNFYRRILHEVLAVLTTEAVPHIVLKGAALADAVYGDPVLRHCHDIDILVREDDLLRGACQLPPLGFSPLGQEISPESHHLSLRHESGLPLGLHRRLFRIGEYCVPLEDLWARSQTQAIAGVSTRVLSPADNLLHICLQACCCSSRESLRWVADAWYIMARHPNLDWDVVLDCAMRDNLALPLSVTLGYLAEEVNAPIPAIVKDRLCAAASQADPVSGEAAVAAALEGTRVDFRCLIRMSGWRSRVLLVKWMLFPSRNYLRSTHQVCHEWLLPFYYVYRPLRYIVRRTWVGGKLRVWRMSSPRDLISSEFDGAGRL